MKLVFLSLSLLLSIAGCTSKQPAKEVHAKLWNAKAHYNKQEQLKKACLKTSNNFVQKTRTIASETSCAGYTSIIYGGQTYNTGYIQVTNDLNNLNVELASNSPSNWRIKAVHIYIGTGPIPTNSQGVPAPGQFPYKEEFGTLQTGLTYQFPIADFSAECGTKLNMAVHTVMVRLDNYGNIVQEETGWAYGPYTFNSSRWGWSFDYTICCQEIIDNGCTLSQGYWKNHNKYAKVKGQKINWPVSEDSLLCGKSWHNILQTKPSSGNAWLILAHQWIAAKLNVSTGASAPDMVSTSITQGGSILSNNCDGISGELRQAALEYSLILDNYNNGIIGPGHCE